MKVQKIRPHQILGLGNDFGKPYTGFIPPPYSGGLLALENIALIKILNLINPKRLFEFGTYRGETTRFIIENLDFRSDKDRKFWTLDIDSLEGVCFEGNDKELALHSVSSKRFYQESKHANTVTQILEDSMKFDPNSIPDKMDFILIDANHAYDYVKNDTEKALKMISPINSVIIWHDYENSQFQGLTKYLDDLAMDGLPLLHIEETMLAIMFSPDINPIKRINSGHIFYNP